MGNQFYPNIELTDDIYFAAQPHEIQALRNIPTGIERTDRVIDLARKGFVIDNAIVNWGWDPTTTMGWREQSGFTWVPSALQPPLNGVIGTGPVPAGAIKVSTRAADYPPVDPPPQPKPSGGPIVGANVLGGNLYTYGTGAYVDGKLVVIDGQTVSQGGQQFKAHVNQFLMGVQVYFERIG